MGYTNYWSVKEIKEFSDDFLRDANKVIDACEVDLAGPCGEEGTDFVLNKKLISLNGVEEASHETFQVSVNQKGFECCKTAEKDYDVVVKCLLMLLADYQYIEPDWSFDGDPETDDLYITAAKIYCNLFNDSERYFNEV